MISLLLLNLLITSLYFTLLMSNIRQLSRQLLPILEMRKQRPWNWVICTRSPSQKGMQRQNRTWIWSWLLLQCALPSTTFLGWRSREWNLPSSIITKLFAHTVSQEKSCQDDLDHHSQLYLWDENEANYMVTVTVIISPKRSCRTWVLISLTRIY